MNRGGSAEIPRELVKRLLLKHMAEHGVSVLELLSAEVHFVDETGQQQVLFDRVAITWGDD